jgi:SNW domain-containing protein 1
VGHLQTKIRIICTTAHYSTVRQLPLQYTTLEEISDGNEESFGGGTEDGIGKALDNDRFGLGQAKVGFEGAAEQEIREGPVQFEKDSGDVFGLDQFLDEAKTGKKRGLDTGA